MLLSDYILQVQQLVHDTAGIDYTTSDITQFVNQARNKVAQDFWCVRTFFTNLSLIINQEKYPMTSGVGGATVTAGGTYLSAPTVTFGAPPAGGVQATGVAIMGGTAPNLFVQQIGMTNWGFGYTSAPTVTFGSGAATATANVLLNVFDIYTITFLFGTQAPMLGWAPFAAFQAYFRSWRIQSGQPGVWSGYNEQNAFYIWPSQPDQNYVIEIDAFVTPFPLVNTTDVDSQVVGPISDCVQFWAAWLALCKAQNFQQADYYRNMYETRAKQVGASRLAPRRPNIYNNLWRRVQRGLA